MSDNESSACSETKKRPLQNLQHKHKRTPHNAHDNSQQSQKTRTRDFTVYLIRHGEARHNAHEHDAQQQARANALAEGCCDKDIQARMEQARQDALTDPSFFDAALSETGREQARVVGKRFLKQKQPFPQLVLVSPLQRTLQTAAIIFPDKNCPHVRVCEELRERVTGRPADNRASATVLANRFRAFSFTSLLEKSQRQILQLWSPNTGSSSSAFLDDDSSCDSSSNVDGDQQDAAGDRLDPHHANSNLFVEDERCLEKRAKQLLELLAANTTTDSEQTPTTSTAVVAVVTHKGYLRTLERCVFGQTNAREFGNCEVRVYKLKLNVESLELQAVERIE
jgi:broad specificity phosphatase PhoE